MLAGQQHFFVDEQQARSHRDRQEGAKNPEQRCPSERGDHGDGAGHRDRPLHDPGRDGVVLQPMRPRANFIGMDGFLFLCASQVQE